MLYLFRSELLSVSYNVLGISNEYMSLKEKKCPGHLPQLGGKCSLFRRLCRCIASADESKKQLMWPAGNYLKMEERKMLFSEGRGIR